jgi:hypothetical protein
MAFVWIQQCTFPNPFSTSFSKATEDVLLEEDFIAFGETWLSSKPYEECI